MPVKNKKNTSPPQTSKVFIGQVVSDKAPNTITISLDYKSSHPIYKKIVRKRHKIYASNNLKAKKGDIVKVKESRPLSKNKRFITLEILKVFNQ